MNRHAGVLVMVLLTSAFLAIPGFGAAVAGGPHLATCGGEGPVLVSSSDSSLSFESDCSVSSSIDADGRLFTRASCSPSED
jgi:hypothetical protein